MLKCYIKGKNLVDGNPREFRIADGAVFTDNYNETLDSGTIVLPHLYGEIEIEPFDSVVVMDGESVLRYMCVDRYVCTQTCLKPAIYKYEVFLFSETKLLEGILCPSLAITRKPEGQVPVKVYEYLRRYLELYGTMVRDPDKPLLVAFKRKFNLGSTLSRFVEMECPEMQWNEPTLREVFNDLMMVDDCIPVVRNDIIDCIDISKVGDEITDSQLAGINYITRSQSSEDYVSEVKMNIQNGINGSVMSGNSVPADATRIVEGIGFRNDDSYLLDTNRIRLQTNFPIWKVFGLKCYLPVRIIFDYRKDAYPGSYKGSVQENVEVDLTDYLFEYNEWLTKDVFYGEWGSSTELSSQYRNTCLFYRRGQRNIENFNGKYDSQFLWINDSKYVVDLIISKANSHEVQLRLYSKAKAWCEENGYEFAGRESYQAGDFKSFAFRLDYEAIDECVFLASKSPLQGARRQIVDNQANSYVNTDRQGLLEYMKANRLGNKVIVANARYASGPEVPALAQTIGGKVIFKREVSFYENHVKANLYATENYVLKDYYTGIRSKLRSWRVVSGSEALLRKEVKKFYVNGSIPTYNDGQTLIPSYATVDEYFNRFKYCVLQIAGDGSQNNCIMLEFTKHKVGKSAVFTVRMNDNYYAGNYISNLTPRVEQKGIRYTNENGTMVWANLAFYSACNYDATASHPNFPRATIKSVDGTGDTFLAKDLVAYIPVKVYKDSKEILQVSLQFEVNEDADNIFYGKSNSF